MNMNKKKILVLFVLLLGSCVIWRSWSLYHTEKEKKQASERKIEAEKDSKPVTSKSEKEEPVKREPTKEELLEQEKDMVLVDMRDRQSYRKGSAAFYDYAGSTDRSRTGCGSRRKYESSTGSLSSWRDYLFCSKF